MWLRLKACSASPPAGSGSDTTIHCAPFASSWRIGRRIRPASSPATAAAIASAGPTGADATLGRRPRQPAYEGSFRQRRGRVLAHLRAGPHPSAALDAAALAALVEDGLAVVDGPLARLP